MFPVRNRLIGDRTIALVFRRGRRSHSAGLTLHVLRSRDVDRLRVTVVVGKKVSKRAVVRNRLKRRIRAVLEERLADLPSDAMLIVVAHPSAVDDTFKQIQSELNDLLTRASLLPLKS